MKINLFLVHNKYKKDIVNAINEILIDFPILTDNVILHMWFLDGSLSDRFASKRNRYNNCSLIQEIKLNPFAFLFPNIDDKLKTVNTANYETVKDIIWHEFGHCLQLYILCDYYKIDLSDYSKYKLDFINKLEDEKNNKKCFKQHMDYYIFVQGWHYDKAKHFLGSYAIKYPKEFIPECFSNYYRLKNKSILDKYEQETFEFVKTVVEDYKKYVPDKV